MSESTKQQHYWISGQLMLVILLFSLQTVRIYSNSTPANLTATDAYPVLGGYVVPVNGSITLHCEAQGPPFDNYTGLQWNIAIGTYSWRRAPIADISGSPSNRFTTLSNTYNPSILRVHNLLQSENGSTVQCVITNLFDTWSQIVTISVEDIPSCVKNLNASYPYIVTWNSYDGLLPVIYNISIWSVNDKVLMSKSIMHPMLHLNESTYSLQSNKTYFVLVTTCNSAGCSQDCGNTTIRTGDLHVKVHDINPANVDNKATSLSVWTLVIIVVPVAVALFTIILIVVVLLLCCITSCRRSKTRNVTRQSSSQQNDHDHMSEREVQETDGVSYTSIHVTGVVMEENPSYGTVPIRMGETDIADVHVTVIK